MKLSTVSKQVCSAMDWFQEGDNIYVIDYTKMLSGEETERQAEDNCYHYLCSQKGAIPVNDRSKKALLNDKHIIIKN